MGRIGALAFADQQRWDRQGVDEFRQRERIQHLPLWELSTDAEGSSRQDSAGGGERQKLSTGSPQSCGAQALHQPAALTCLSGKS
jgi:hypothetical protein